MSVIKITGTNFKKEVLESAKPVLLDFYADWCGPCQMVSPIVDEIANEHPEYTVGKINVDNEYDLALAFAVTSIPTLVCMKNGQMTNKIVGLVAKETILKMME